MGYEFYILQGNVHFRRSTSGSSQAPIMTISPEYGLRSFRMSLRGSPLYNSATVIGMNTRNNRRIRERVNISPSVRQYTHRILGGADKTDRDYSINSSRRARDKANTQISGAQNEFRSLSGTCIGIPELAPGRNIRVQGVSPEGDRVFYLTSVSHSLDDNGFSTSWEARVNV
jgi:phage protein D